METILASLWLLPFYYIISSSYILHFNVFLLDISPWAGLIGLLYGVIWAIVHRKIALGWFVISPVLSHVVFGTAGLFARQLNSHDTTWLISAFWSVQLAILIFLVYRAKGMRIPAAALAAFGFSYALHAGFFSAMTLTGAWW